MPSDIPMSLSSQMSPSEQQIICSAEVKILYKKLRLPCHLEKPFSSWIWCYKFRLYQMNFRKFLLLCLGGGALGLPPKKTKTAVLPKRDCGLASLSFRFDDFYNTDGGRGPMFGCDSGGFGKSGLAPDFGIFVDFEWHVAGAAAIRYMRLSFSRLSPPTASCSAEIVFCENFTKIIVF